MTRLTKYDIQQPVPDMTPRQVELLTIRHHLARIASMIPMRSVAETVEAVRVVLSALEEHQKNRAA